MFLFLLRWLCSSKHRALSVQNCEHLMQAAGHKACDEGSLDVRQHLHASPATLHRYICALNGKEKVEMMQRLGIISATRN